MPQNADPVLVAAQGAKPVRNRLGAARIGAFGDHDQAAGLAGSLTCAKPIANRPQIGWQLGYLDFLRAPGDSHRQRDEAGVPPHHFDEKESFVGLGGVPDLVQSLHALLRQETGRLQHARFGLELGASGRVKDGPALLQDVSDVATAQPTRVPAYQSLVAAPHPQNLVSVGFGHAHDGADGRVHPGSVAPAGQGRDLHGSSFRPGPDLGCTKALDNSRTVKGNRATPRIARHAPSPKCLVLSNAPRGE